MAAIIKIFLIIHIASGFTALSTGFFSMLNRKGGKNHRLTGKIFFGGMTGVFITAISLSILKPNPFLFMVGFFSYYLACSGYRALHQKTINGIPSPQVIDWLISGTGVVFGLGLIGFSVFWFQSRGAWGFVPFTFGIFCLSTSYKDVRGFYQQNHDKALRFINHGSKMGGAFAATVTAFIVVNFTLGDYTWVLWILPGVLIGIWIAKNVNAFKRKADTTTGVKVKIRNNSMLKQLIILGLIFFSKILYAQEVTLRGKVVNDSLQPVKYVSVGVINTSIGTVSDAAGTFTLRINKASITEKDSLKFSSIGYHSKSISLYHQLNKQVKDGDNLTIMLEQKITDLPELVITPAKGIAKTIGTNKKSLMNLVVNFAESDRLNQNLGSEIGRKFQIRNQNTRVDALKFFISQNNFDKVRFRVNVYSLKQGKPQQNLLTENIYVDLSKKLKGWIEVDLTQYNIVVSENIVVALEWISKSAKGNVLTLPIVMPTTQVHFYKYGSQNKWKRFDSMSTYMELKIRE
jgi:hypothetical protein